MISQTDMCRRKKKTLKMTTPPKKTPPPQKKTDPPPKKKTRRTLLKTTKEVQYIDIDTILYKKEEKSFFDNGENTQTSETGKKFQTVEELNKRK